jgi:hypothetical protein
MRSWGPRLSSILLLVALTATASAKVTGQWRSTKNSYNSSIVLSIYIYDDGSLVGTIAFPGGVSALYDLTSQKGQLQFSVDQWNNSTLVTYDCDARVSGNTMDGTCTNEDVPSDVRPFRATRAK